MSQPDLLLQFALRNAGELEQLEVQLQVKIKALEEAVDPLQRRLSLLKHRAMWLQQARQKLSELAGVCRAADPDEIPF